MSCWRRTKRTPTFQLSTLNAPSTPERAGGSRRTRGCGGPTPKPCASASGLCPGCSTKLGTWGVGGAQLKGNGGQAVEGHPARAIRLVDHPTLWTWSSISGDGLGHVGTWDSLGPWPLGNGWLRSTTPMLSRPASSRAEIELKLCRWAPRLGSHPERCSCHAASFKHNEVGESIALLQLYRITRYCNLC